jgi:hypothetical protein
LSYEPIASSPARKGFSCLLELLKKPPRLRKVGGIPGKKTGQSLPQDPEDRATGLSRSATNLLTREAIGGCLRRKVGRSRCSSPRIRGTLVVEGR